MELATLNLDTYKVVTLLQEKGYSKEAAEGFIAAIQEITLSGVATKQDLLDVKTDLEKEIKKINDKLSSMDIKMSSMKVWFMGLVLGQTLALLGAMFAMLQFS